MDRPLRFAPFLRPMVWGGRRLAEHLRKPLPTSEPYGESWEVSDHARHRSIVAEGPRTGQSLRQLMETEAAALLGPAAGLPIFPWLVKFLDASDWLSVQVHPDEEAVRRLWPGEEGKTEAWFVLQAAPGSRIYAGLRPGVDEQQLRQALQSGTVAECLHAFEPRPGDCVYLPAGTVHAVGGGVLMAEIQQTSDATFRLFDWNRRDSSGKERPLHVEQALACIDWRQGPVQPRAVAGYAEHSGRFGNFRQPLVRCRYFELEYLHASEAVQLGGTGRLQLVVVCQGAGRWDTGHGELVVQTGQAWVLPAAQAATWCRPEPSLGLLLGTLPA